MVVPTVLLFQAAVRMRPGALYACAVMVVFGFITNRLNVGITGLEAGSGTHYIPKWSEVAVTLVDRRRGLRDLPLRRADISRFSRRAGHEAGAR